MQFQLVPPHMHLQNAAERAIITFNNHFIAALCTVYPHFPFYVWDHILPKVTMTLNMLQQSRLNPVISAYKQGDGVQNFNAYHYRYWDVKCKFIKIHTRNAPKFSTQ